MNRLPFFCFLIGLSACSSSPDYSDSPQFKDGEFYNSESPALFYDRFSEIIIPYIFGERPDEQKPVKYLIEPIDPQSLSNPDPAKTTVYRLGHSTVLLSLNGEWWLTDPHFSNRASPLSWVGPKRFHPPPIAMEDLPPLAGIIISHNHYDHLDEQSIKGLKNKTHAFYVPLGLTPILSSWGVNEEKIHEMDWWDRTEVDRPSGPIEIVATPAQHFSNRTLFDTNETLWASWVILNKQQNRETSLYFSGDTGYFSGFKKIGERYGPFDLVMLETGAYNKLWPGVHLVPEQTLQAFRDLRGKQLMPIHNLTFDLSRHTWYAPMQHIYDLSQQEGIEVFTQVVGKAVVVGEKYCNRPWWQELREN